jgi:shikimate dehydrogenase
MRYAEIIGDPVSGSKSPRIHSYWLARLNLPGEYRRTQVPRQELPDFLRARRDDPDWLGCNLTMPHKEAAVALVDQLGERARTMGSVNCVVPREGLLRGANTDVDGIASALDEVRLEGRKAAIIGAGGAARAAVAYLAGRDVTKIGIIVRDPGKADVLRSIARKLHFEIGDFSDPGLVLEGSEAIINASPLGMIGCDEMPTALLKSVARHSPGRTLLDMVYHPIGTQFLATGRSNGARTVDGLTVLIGQAARAFEMFFGHAPPPPDERLSALLVTESGD